MEPTVAFIIPFWGTDPYRVGSFDYLQSVLQERFTAADCIAYTGYRGLKNRSAARNALAADHSGEVLVILDADTVPDPNALLESVHRVLMTRTWMLPYTTYYTLTENGSKEFMADPPWKAGHPEDTYDHEYVFPGPDPAERPPAVAGCVVVHRDAFHRVHGYDERFEGWGGEDRAFALALETLVEHETRHPASIHHLWHPAPEEGRFANPNWERNRELLSRYEDCRNSPARMHALVSEQ